MGASLCGTALCHVRGLRALGCAHCKRKGGGLRRGRKLQAGVGGKEQIKLRFWLWPRAGADYSLASKLVLWTEAHGFICGQIDLLSCPLSSAASNLGCFPSTTRSPCRMSSSSLLLLLQPTEGMILGLLVSEEGLVSFLCVCRYGTEMSFQGTN